MSNQEQEQGESLFNQSLNDIKRRKNRKSRGLHNTIPVGLERFGEFYPGVEQESLTIVAADTKGGKTKFTKQLYVHDVIDFVLSPRAGDITAEIFYFCLEESKIKFMQTLQIYRLFKKHGIRRGIKELHSKWEELSDRELELLENDREFFEFVEQHVHVIDDIHHPYGMYMHMIGWLEQNGETIKKTVTREKDGQMQELNVFDYYVPTDPNKYVIVIVDHAAKAVQKGLTQHETMAELSNYFMKLRDRYMVAAVIVQQLAISSLGRLYTNKGDKIIESVEPSIDKLGNNKELARDADNIFFLFGPSLYKIENYESYDINRLGNHFRALIVGRARDMDDGIFVPMFFDGKTGVYEELPKPEDMTAAVYDQYSNRTNPIQLSGNNFTLNFQV